MKYKQMRGIEDIEKIFHISSPLSVIQHDRYDGEPAEGLETVLPEKVPAYASGRLDPDPLPEQIEDTDQKYPFISVVYPQNNFRRPHPQIDLCRFQQPMSALFKHSKQEHTQKKSEKYILLVKILQIAVKGKIVRHL